MSAMTIPLSAWTFFLFEPRVVQGHRWSASKPFTGAGRKANGDALAD
jgi:hypothetical protein